MNDEMLRLSLIEVTDNDLLNDFVNDVFGYNLKSDEYIYIQFKIVHDNIVLNFFDNSNNNRFKAYIFTEKDFDNGDENIVYINVRSCLLQYKNSNNKLVLLGALLMSKDNDEKKEIIDSLFDNDIKKIFMKNFIS